MLKINLLPPYIYEAGRKRLAFVVWVVAVLAVVGSFVAYRVILDGRAGEFDQMRLAEEPKQRQKQQAESEAASIRTASGAIRAKRDFVRDALAYNRNTYPPRVFNIRDYTLNTVIYSSLQPAGQTVTMEAFAPTLADVGRYLMWMEHNPNITNVAIAIGSIPGFPSEPLPEGVGPDGRPIGGHNFTVTLTLREPIPGAPSFGVAAQQPTVGMMPGPGGMMGGGMPGPPMMSPGGMPGAPMMSPGRPGGAAPAPPMIGPGFGGGIAGEED
ncbi:MAG TPA: hypothetical protein VLH79_09735 [Chthonomonadales bacterium]|nr:hypothetical protein [Chthonomonadales bacterium]